MFDQGLQFDTHERWTTYLLSRSQLDATEKDEPSPNIFFLIYVKCITDGWLNLNVTI